jgi:hypothetical protein
MLRTNCLAQLLLARLLTLGAMSENEALDALEARAPGRSREVVEFAEAAGMLRRVEHDDGPMLEAAGARRTRLAA